jgi:hypothetical protein
VKAGTIQRRQDREDGRALRELEEALPGGWGFSVSADGPGYVVRATSYKGTEVEAWSACDHLDICQCPLPTIAQAADACREALAKA